MLLFSADIKLNISESMNKAFIVFMKQKSYILFSVDLVYFILPDYFNKVHIIHTKNLKLFFSERPSIGLDIYIKKFFQVTKLTTKTTRH